MPFEPPLSMTLTAGRRLGPYEIAAPLGAGGMGEVELASQIAHALAAPHERGSLYITPDARHHACRFRRVLPRMAGDTTRRLRGAAASPVRVGGRVEAL